MDNDDYDEIFADEAIEVTEADDTANYNRLVGELEKDKPKVTKPGLPKRETKPRLKYTEYDLIGAKGLIAFKRSFENYKLPTDGKEPFKDLDDVLKKMELWAHRLHPSIQFDDFLAKTEQLGKKRTVKTYMSKMRMGMDLQENDEAIFEKPKKKQSKADKIVIIE